MNLYDSIQTYPQLGSYEWLNCGKYPSGKNRGGGEKRRRGKKWKGHNKHRPYSDLKQHHGFHLASFELIHQVADPDRAYVFRYRQCTEPKKKLPRKYSYLVSRKKARCHSRIR